MADKVEFDGTLILPPPRDKQEEDLYLALQDFATRIAIMVEQLNERLAGL